MTRRLPFAITTALLVLLLVQWGAVMFAVGYYTKRKERDLGESLGRVAATFTLSLENSTLASLATTYETLALLDDDAAPAIDANGALPLPETPLAPQQARELSASLTEVVTELRDTVGLRSVAVLSEGGITLASTISGDEAGFRSVLYEIDRPELAEAARTGAPVAKPLYLLDGTLQKRVYLALPLAYVPVGDGLRPAPRVFLRLEASPPYLTEIERLRRLGRLVMLGGSGLVAALGLLFYFLTRRLQLSMDRLAREDRFRSLGRLAAGLAHELRNPLGILRFGLEELGWMGKQRPTDTGDSHHKGEAITRLTTEMLEEVDRLNRLVTNILSMSQGAELDGRGQCPLGETVAGCTRWLAKSAPQQWRLDLPEKPETAHERTAAITADALRQVLLNLLRNATEALEGQEDPRPSIAVRIEQLGETEARVVVEDNGPGIPRRHARRLFEPFNTTREQGTGLGLAISRRLVESAGGTIAYEPNGQRGSRFVLRLPLLAPQ